MTTPTPPTFDRLTYCDLQFDENDTATMIDRWKELISSLRREWAVEMEGTFDPCEYVSWDEWFLQFQYSTTEASVSIGTVHVAVDGTIFGPGNAIDSLRNYAPDIIVAHQ